MSRFAVSATQMYILLLIKAVYFPCDDTMRLLVQVPASGHGGPVEQRAGRLSATTQGTSLFFLFFLCVFPLIRCGLCQ